MKSPLLSLPGAVAAEGRDEGVAGHYGDLFREQRALADGNASSTSPTAVSSPSPVTTG